MNSRIRYVTLTALTAVIFVAAAPWALAHDRDSMVIDPACIGDANTAAIGLFPSDAEWLNDYLTLGEVQYVLERGLTREMLRCYFEREAIEVEALAEADASHPVSPNPKPKPAAVSGSVEAWRPLVAAYFPSDWVEWALRIIQCESRGDPNAENPTSGAAGLFQHIPRYWEERSAKAGWAEASIWDPEANVAVAAWLLGAGGTSNWTCKAPR